MRLAALLALGAALASCKGGDDAKADDSRAPRAARPAAPAPAPITPGSEGEQARFDRERRPDLIIAALGLKPGMTVADVGAGTGLLTVHVARAIAPNGKVVATDVDSAVLDLLGSRLGDAGLGNLVERRVVAPDMPGLEPNTYDAILLSEVDHFFSDRVAWLRAAIPALKPGGHLVITNRTYHRQPALDAAQTAGLTLDHESTEVPGEFIATFSVGRKP